MIVMTVRHRGGTLNVHKVGYDIYAEVEIKTDAVSHWGRKTGFFAPMVAYTWGMREIDTFLDIVKAAS